MCKVVTSCALTAPAAIPSLEASGSAPSPVPAARPALCVTEAAVLACSFADERLDTKHRFGSVSMANTGERNSNGCQFFIVTAADEDAAFLDGKHVVVGHVLAGLDTLRAIEAVPTVGADGRPLRKVQVDECGQLLGHVPGMDAGGDVPL